MDPFQTVGLATSLSPYVVQSDSDDPGIVVLFLILFGVISLYGGWQRYQSRRLVQDTPTETARSMAAGRTELEGRALPRGKPFFQPFGDGTAVVGYYRIEEYEKDSDDEGSDWKTKEFNEFTDPFFLEDETGRALIDADDGVDLEISDENTTRITVGSTEEEPDVVKEFLRNHSSMGVPDSGLSGVVFGEKRRYTQKVIPPGEDVYVFGGATPRPDTEGANAEGLVVGEEESTGRFVVSDMSEDTLVSQYGWSALGIIALGVVLLALAFYIIVTELGLAG